ncbi:MAG: K+/H+ antiporter subunit F [Burkholderiaceae bacterium]|nr:K+/H+ antiporter subunit F [Burkholderiaceae bacterium]
MIVELALDFALAAVALAMALCGWRMLRGPGLPDRILALDTLYISAVALVVLLGIRWQTALLFEAALIIALLGFVATVAAARFVTRGSVVE